MTQTELIEAVKRISKEAGSAIMEVYERNGAIPTDSKADNSPLTEADIAAHKIITAELRKLTPDIPILSEESAAISWNERKNWNRYWLVDPLDGTKEFIKRNGEFTVNIALIDQHKPVLGVVYVPPKNTLYWGGVAVGAFKEADQEITAIRTKSTNRGGIVKVVASRSHRGEELDAWLEKMQKTFSKVELVSMGSSLKICLVAEGKADIYPRLALTSEWDTAAAQAILEAAGGVIKDIDFKVYLYNLKENILNPYFYAIGDKDFNWQDL